jgi:hypothetical protein
LIMSTSLPTVVSILAITVRGCGPLGTEISSPGSSKCSWLALLIPLSFRRCSGRMVELSIRGGLRGHKDTQPAREARLNNLIKKHSPSPVSKSPALIGGAGGPTERDCQIVPKRCCQHLPSSAMSCSEGRPSEAKFQGSELCLVDFVGTGPQAA